MALEYSPELQTHCLVLTEESQKRTAQRAVEVYLGKQSTVALLLHDAVIDGTKVYRGDDTIDPVVLWDGNAEATAAALRNLYDDTLCLPGGEHLQSLYGDRVEAGDILGLPRLVELPKAEVPQVPVQRLSVHESVRAAYTGQDTEFHTTGFLARLKLVLTGHWALTH